MADQHSHQEWFDRLGVKSQLGELTMSEDMLLTLHYINNNLARLVPNLETAREGIEHIEGMVGAVDAMLGKTAPGYPTSSKVREALDRQRDQERRKALEAREDASS